MWGHDDPSNVTPNYSFIGDHSLELWPLRKHNLKAFIANTKNTQRIVDQVEEKLGVLHPWLVFSTTQMLQKTLQETFVLLYLTPNDLISTRGGKATDGEVWHMLHPHFPSSYNPLIWGPCSAGPSPCLMSVCSMINPLSQSITGVRVYLWYFHNPFSAGLCIVGRENVSLEQMSGLSTKCRASF